jgi:Zn-dependent M28 family amino/carboxypeptidase
MKKVQPTNAIRFAWWGAEELGLLGSRHYVTELAKTPGEIDKIALYLNFDMIASPNYVRFVYDGDNSDAEGEGAGPAGSDVIEDVFTNYFTAVGLDSEGTDFSGRSDYGPFIAAGIDIPSGGLFTGAEGIKTAAQAARYGGVAGVAYDPCYHERCDALRNFVLSDADQAIYAQLSAAYPLIGNVNMRALEENIDAIAHSVITFAYSTEAVNGVVGDNGKGKTKIKRAPGGGVSGGAGDPTGGGLHDEHDHEVPAA